MPAPGLCAACTHVRPIANDRGSVFYLCERGLREARWAKYPRLPVLQCTGYEESDPECQKKTTATEH